MKNKWLKILVLVAGLGAPGVVGFYIWQSEKLFSSLPLPDLTPEEVASIQSDGGGSGHGAVASVHGTTSEGHGAPPAADAHGAPAADAHGAPAADAHGAPAADAHGAPAADAHGAPAADAHGGGGGHGAAAAATRSPAGMPLISFDEIFVNVFAADEGARSLALKLDLELFEEGKRPLVDQRQSGVKDTIISVAKEQDFYRLNTLSGKLYFKERLVSQINAFFRSPVVKEVHFSSFFLQ